MVYIFFMLDIVIILARKTFSIHLHFLTSWFGNHTNWIYILVIQGRRIILYCANSSGLSELHVKYFLFAWLENMFHPTSFFTSHLLFSFTFSKILTRLLPRLAALNSRFNAKIFQISHLLQIYMYYLNAF